MLYAYDDDRSAKTEDALVVCRKGIKIILHFRHILSHHNNSTLFRNSLDRDSSINNLNFIRTVDTLQK